MPEHELITLERAGWAALSSTGDAASTFYSEVLASSPVMLLPGGVVIDDRPQV